MSPTLCRLFAILGLWVLSVASAYASPGADCHGHASAKAARHTSVQAPPRQAKSDLASLPANLSQLQARLALASPPAETPAVAQSDEACGSCLHCSACCWSVAPPMALALPVLLDRADAFFPAPGLAHRSPDLAALERPPQPAPTRKTA